MPLPKAAFGQIFSQRTLFIIEYVHMG